MLKILRPLFLILISCTVFSHTSIGQERRNLFSFNGGYSLPVGKFASKAFDDPRAGMADAGYFGQINYERKLSRGFGLRLSAVHNINKTNADPLIQKADELVFLYGSLIGESGPYSWDSRTSNWKMTSLMFGPAVYVPLGVIELEGHVQAGRLFVTSPDATLYGSSQSGNNPITAQMFSIDAQNWGFGGGISLRIALGPVVQLQLFADALAADMTFTDIALHGKIGEMDVIQQVSEKRAVGVVNAGAGLAFRF